MRSTITPSPTQPPQRRTTARGSFAALVLTLLAVAAVLAGWSSFALASTYDVSICGTGSGAGTSDGLSVVDYGGNGYMNTVDQCMTGSPKIMHGAFVPAGYSSFTWTGNPDGTATISAPAGTTIQSLTMRAAIAGFGSYFTWDVTAPGGRMLSRWAAYYGSPSSFNGTLSYAVNASSVSSRFFCAQSTCSGTGTTVLLSAITPRISDTSAPSFTSVPSGSLLAGGPLRGTKGVSFSATDVGGGIYKVGLLVDGRDEQLQVPDANGGRCAKPFTYMVPCKLSVSSSFAIDTTRIPDGEHDVQVVAYDATEEGRAVSAPTTITIHNAPTSIDRPQLTGTPRLGDALAASTGTWQGSPTGYSYQWLRCPAAITSPAQADGCSPIAGATRPNYTPGTDDAYKRNTVRVTATNASGTGSAYSAPSDLVADTQGRTSPPPADDGGSRDVVIVPVTPGGSSSSSTTIINPPANGGASAIAGLTNPLGGLGGHIANGTNATENAHIRIAFEIRRGHTRKRVSAVRSTRNRRWVIKGTLVNAQGRPIAGGQLVTAWQINGSWSARTGVKTRADGRFTYILPKGPSRSIKFVYYAFSDSTSYGESNAIVERVATPVKLGVSPKAARNGRDVRFAGTVGTDFLPKAGVLVTLEAHYTGGNWKQFRVVRTGRGGRFGVSYRFTHTSNATTYSFRARVAKQAGYPFEGGTSRRVEVRVSP
jgi:hypothetical protein